jgi:polyphosphate glucokinase
VRQRDNLGTMPAKSKKRSTKPLRVLVIDVGGSKIKLRNSADNRVQKFPSGKTMTARKMVEEAVKLTSDWEYDVVSIGFPGPVVHGRPTAEPVNIGGGWKRYNFKKAFGKPVRLINDAAMQALGSYRQGRMLFLGLGTGLGSSLIVDDVMVPLELGELRYSRRKTLEDVLGKRGLKEIGSARWQRVVHASVANLKKAFLADHVVIGGGNVKRLKRLPRGARRGSNLYAFRGGVRLWQKPPIGAEVQKHTLTIT